MIYFSRTSLLLVILLSLTCLFVGEKPHAWSAENQDAVADESTATPTEHQPEEKSEARPPRFTFADTEMLARALAVTPYDPKINQVPEPLLALSKEQWEALRIKPEYILWQNEGLPFAIGLFHPGYIFNRSAEINIVDERGVTKIPFSADMFHAENEAIFKQIHNLPAGFAGFQLFLPSESSEDAYGNESNNRLSGFMGASTFMFKGRNARLGSFARTVTLDTALPSGEMFPYFREFWLVKPKPGDTALTVYALMDSPGLTGAFQLVITPGTSTVIKVESRMFSRRGASHPSKVGIAPLASMFLYCETQNGKPGDFRPEVHNADGLLLTDGDERWSWRPLCNNERLNISVFPMANPRGFGLLQRDNQFDHFQDIANRFDRRASVWVEPVGDWGGGRLELLELPGSRDFHNNILSFWVPDNVETAISRDDTLPPNGNVLAFPPCFSYSYVMYWMPSGVSPHSLGRAQDTRLIREADSDEVTFLVDFEGGELNEVEPSAGLTSVVEGPEQAVFLGKTLIKNPETAGWRLAMRFRVPQNGMLQRILTAREGPSGLRFRAYLKKGENIVEPLTETWIYDLVP